MAKKTTSHRKPPKPIHWNCKRGTCRFCGEDIIENGKQNRRKHWHEACAHTWQIMNDPKTARLVVHRRDNFTCQKCGLQGLIERFDVDHIKPLFEANGDPSYWQLPNLRLLCVECHKDKTREDMIRYREAKRLLSEVKQEESGQEEDREAL